MRHAEHLGIFTYNSTKYRHPIFAGKVYLFVQYICYRSYRNVVKRYVFIKQE